MRRDSRRRLRKAAKAAQAAAQTRQAASAPTPAPLPVVEQRRGLTARFAGVLARRRVVNALTTPAAAGLVAVAVVAVFAAVAVGAIIGAALATRHGGGGEW